VGCLLVMAFALVLNQFMPTRKGAAVKIS
jgi:hypothetical protein